jgi:hypothetical protein
MGFQGTYIVLSLQAWERSRKMLLSFGVEWALSLFSQAGIYLASMCCKAANYLYAHMRYALCHCPRHENCERSTEPDGLLCDLARPQ